MEESYCNKNYRKGEGAINIGRNYIKVIELIIAATIA